MGAAPVAPPPPLLAPGRAVPGGGGRRRVGGGRRLLRAHALVAGLAGRRFRRLAAVAPVAW
eukprot:481810-Prymnesium_polylepis.1